MGYFDDHDWLPEWKHDARKLVEDIFAAYEDVFESQIAEIAKAPQQTAKVCSICLQVMRLTSLHSRLPLTNHTVLCLTTTTISPLSSHLRLSMNSKNTSTSRASNAVTSSHGGTLDPTTIQFSRVWL